MWTKEKQREFQKQWYLDNKERLKEQRHQYYLENKEYFKKLNKQNYHNNKDIINEKRREISKTLKSKFNRAKNQAKFRNYDWNISFDDYLKLIQSDCIYCENILPSVGHGLDRKNNKIGYELDNVVPCCKHCNKLKSDLLSHEEMLEIVKFLKISRNKKDIWNE